MHVERIVKYYESGEMNIELLGDLWRGRMGLTKDQQVALSPHPKPQKALSLAKSLKHMRKEKERERKLSSPSPHVGNDKKANKTHSEEEHHQEKHEKRRNQSPEKEHGKEPSEAIGQESVKPLDSEEKKNEEQTGSSDATTEVPTPTLLDNITLVTPNIARENVSVPLIVVEDSEQKEGTRQRHLHGSAQPNFELYLLALLTLDLLLLSLFC
jgi:hypothetical protein